MAGLVPATHVLMPCKFKGVDGRDIRAFTPVFDGLLPGHDDVDRLRTSQVGITSLRWLSRMEI